MVKYMIYIAIIGLWKIIVLLINPNKQTKTKWKDQKTKKENGGGGQRERGGKKDNGFGRVWGSLVLTKKQADSFELYLFLQLLY